MKKLKLYLDSCCFNRPFDDLSQDKIRIESEAIITIIDKCEDGTWDIFESDILDDEFDRMTNPVKNKKFWNCIRHLQYILKLTMILSTEQKNFCVKI